MSFLIEDDFFFCILCFDHCFMIGTYHGNKIDKVGKMIWPQFPTEVLQIMTDMINVTIHKKSSLEQFIFT